MTDLSKGLVYVVEDEPEIGKLICGSLAEYGFRTEHFTHGRAFLRRLKGLPPALAIIDLGLPDGDGLQVLREAQAQADCAVIILSGRGHTSDRVVGLELGADDYVVKPFEPRELVARVRSVLRRWDKARTAPHRAGRVRFANWCFDLDTHTVTDAGGAATVLSTAEADLLKAMVKSPNRILSRGQLLDLRDEADPFDRSIDVRISRLRRKLEADPQFPRLIKTVYGAGYMFCAEVTWE
jgi:DNA-binding response OmpR family regulator